MNETRWYAGAMLVLSVLILATAVALAVVTTRQKK